MEKIPIIDPGDFDRIERVHRESTRFFTRAGSHVTGYLFKKNDITMGE